MSLIDRIAALFRRTMPAEEETTLTRLPPDANREIYDRFTAVRQRKKTIELCRKMYDTDSRIDGILHSVARDAVKGGFVISVQNNPTAQDEADALVSRLELLSRLDDYCRLAMRDGDLFLEIGVNGSGEIAKLSRKPTLEMHRASNQFDEFEDSTKAFWWHDKDYVLGPPEDEVIWFAEWQMVHARWSHDEGNRYGRQLFKAATAHWARATEGEIDVSVRRKTRAGLRWHHILEGATWDQIEEYQERNRSALEGSLSGTSDFFSTQPGGLKAVQGDATLSEIGDIMHHISTFWISSPIPMGVLGYGEQLNRDVLEQQREQYHTALEQIDQWISRDIIVPLLERQWLLQGIYPDSLEYEIEWGMKHAVTPQSMMQVAQAITQLSLSGKVSDEAILRILARFLPQFDYRAELAALQTREQQGVAAIQGLLRGE